MRAIAYLVISVLAIAMLALVGCGGDEEGTVVIQPTARPAAAPATAPATALPGLLQQCQLPRLSIQRQCPHRLLRPSPRRVASFDGCPRLPRQIWMQTTAPARPHR